MFFLFAQLEAEDSEPRGQLQKMGLGVNPSTHGEQPRAIQKHPP